MVEQSDGHTSEVHSTVTTPCAFAGIALFRGGTALMVLQPINITWGGVLFFNESGVVF
jgi:hypothetical protein